MTHKNSIWRFPKRGSTSEKIDLLNYTQIQVMTMNNYRLDIKLSLCSSGKSL